MMRKILLIFIYLLPLFGFCQEWKQYSDSVISNIKNNNFNKANYYIDLADNNINKSTVKKDTTYADYLYRKGVVKYDSGKFDEALFEESLSIWEITEKKNYSKLMKIHYFLGAGYHQKLDYVKGYKNYEKCYLINKKNKLTWNNNYANSLYYLAVIDYNKNLNYKKAQQYAQEYIEYCKGTYILNYDFNYAYAFRWKEDSQGYENVLLEFKKNYENDKLNKPQLYFQINFELYTFYYKQIKIEEIIKYGEKSVEIYKTSKINDKKFIMDLYPKLSWAYSEINDEENRLKYESLTNDLQKSENEK